MQTRASAVEVIAHRGASAYAAEHTWDAYDIALAQGAHMLELDVRATADGEIVVLHDPTLARTAGVARAVADMTSDELRRLPARARPLTLDSVLERYGSATRYLVELKDPLPEWEGKVVAALERHDLCGRAVLQSFDALALRRIHCGAPHLSVAPLLRRAPRRLSRIEAFAPFACAIGPSHAALSAELVAAARACGLGVRVWTLDEPERIERALSLGVDGVITNAPDVAGAVAAGSAAPVAA